MKCNYKRKLKKYSIQIESANRFSDLNIEDKNFVNIEISVCFRCKNIDEKYFKPNLTLTQLRELIKLRI